MSARPVFRLVLRAEPRVDDPVRELRRALKVLLRRFKLRCVSVEEIGTGANTPEVTP